MLVLVVQRREGVVWPRLLVLEEAERLERAIRGRGRRWLWAVSRGIGIGVPSEFECEKLSYAGKEKREAHAELHVTIRALYEDMINTII